MRTRERLHAARRLWPRPRRCAKTGQTATQRFVPDLTQILLRKKNGATLSAAARAMATKQGFTQTLRDQRMTFRQFVDAHPQFRVESRGAASRVFASDERTDTAGTLMPYAVAT